MNKLTALSAGTTAVIVALGLGLSAQTNPAPVKTAPKPAMAVAHKTQPTPEATAQPELTKQYCIGCHSDKGKAGGLSLVAFEAAHAEQNPEVAEKIIHKLRLGMMPPPGVRRPDAAVLHPVRHDARVQGGCAPPRFVRTRGGGRSSGSTAPSTRTRSRPARSRRRRQRVPAARHAQRRLRQHRRRPDLLGDADGRVPARGPQIADARGRRPQTREPVGVHRQGPAHRIADAARRRHAVGHARRPRVVTPFRPTATTRSASCCTGRRRVSCFGSVVEPQRADRPVDQRRAGRAAWTSTARMTETDKNGLNLIDAARSMSSAGPQHIAAAFIQQFDGAVDDLMSPIDYTLADTEIGDSVGITILPHVRDFSITGPYKVTGVSDTPSRRRSSSCRPTSPTEEIAVRDARSSSGSRPGLPPAADSDDVESLMKFYGEGAQGAATSRPASSPPFRRCSPARTSSSASRARRRCEAGQSYRISDIDLASRLSFFIWDTVPDAELVKVADARHAATRRRCSRSRCGACSPIRAPKRCPPASRRSGSGCRTSTRFTPTRCCFPLRQRARALVQARDRAVLRQHRARGSQRPRPAHRRLHLRQRAASPAHYGIPNIVGRQFPARHAARRTAAAFSVRAAS